MVTEEKGNPASHWITPSRYRASRAAGTAPRAASRGRSSPRVPRHSPAPKRRPTAHRVSRLDSGEISGTASKYRATRGVVSSEAPTVAPQVEAVKYRTRRPALARSPFPAPGLGSSASRPRCTLPAHRRMPATAAKESWSPMWAAE